MENRALAVRAGIVVGLSLLFCCPSVVGGGFDSRVHSSTVPSNGTSLRGLSQVASAGTPFGTIIATIPVGSGPDAIGYDGGQGYVYVSNANSNNLSVINGTAVLDQSIGLGLDTYPEQLAYDSVDGYEYVALFGSDKVALTQGYGAELVGVGPYPFGIAVDPRDGYVYVSDSGSSNVTVLNGTNLVDTIPVAVEPFGVAYDAQDGLVYVANDDSDNVSVIDGTSVVASVPVGAAPWMVSYDPRNGFVYVTDKNSENVSVIDGTAEIASIRVGGEPLGITYDGGNGYVYVANAYSQNVSVIDGTKALGSIPVSSSPWSVTYDSRNGYLYVADFASDSVSVINTSETGCSTCTVKFSESGLPSGTEWWANLTNGPHFHSTKSAISFKEPNGTYQFSIATTDKLYQAAGGTFTVAGANVTEKVKFTLVTYKVTFDETGLPSGTEWWVNLTNGQSFHTTKTSLSFDEANGTYSFSTATTNKSYTAPSGKFTVDGGKVTKKVKFSDPATNSAAGSRIISVARWRWNQPIRT